MDDIDTLTIPLLAVGVALIILFGYVIFDETEHERNFALGSVVTTTSAYECLMNDSFTGVVVRGEGWRDPALTVRNRDGVERRIATEFLEPVD